MPAPAICAGDVNCHHTGWGYKHTTKDGETMSDWASSAEAALLYDSKEPPPRELLLCTMEHIHHGPKPRPQARTTHHRYYLSGHTIVRQSSKCHRWFSRYLVNQLSDRTPGKLIGSYSPQRLKEEHHISQLHKLTTRCPYPHRIATCLYTQ